VRPTGQRARISLATPQPARRAIVAPQYGRRDFIVRRLLAVGDGAAIVASLALAAAIGGLRTDTVAYLFWGVVSLPLWVLLFKAYGLYDRDIKRVSHTTLDDLPWLFHAAVIGSLLMWLYYRFLPVDQLVFAEVAIFGAALLVLTPLVRAGVRRGAARAVGPERVLLVSDDRMTELLVRKLRAHPEYGLEPIGIVSVGPKHGPPRADATPLPTLGDLDDLIDIVNTHDVERLVVSHGAGDDELLVDVLRRCKQLSIKVSVLPQLLDVMGPSVEVDDVEGVTVLGINPPVLSRSSRAVKRGMDIAGASVALALSLPVLAVVAIAIKVDSRGPLLFRQQRIGKDGRRFRVAKFRTMSADAEAQREALLAQSKSARWLHLEHDPRVTRVGRFLRMTSLDELPQLWNVLRGEMSLVGPRPLIEAEDAQVTGWGRSRLDLTPGITGYWQVLGRTNIPFEEMIKLDYLYVSNWSLWGDIRLILRTLPAVLRQRGAN
jgi:exopolysaccharide biosynthesis polyprenyl glycosylphosphotransferase